MPLQTQLVADGTNIKLHRLNILQLWNMMYRILCNKWSPSNICPRNLFHHKKHYFPPETKSFTQVAFFSLDIHAECHTETIFSEKHVKT